VVGLVGFKFVLMCVVWLFFWWLDVGDRSVVCCLCVGSKGICGGGG